MPAAWVRLKVYIHITTTTAIFNSKTSSLFVHSTCHDSTHTCHTTWCLLTMAGLSASLLFTDFTACHVCNSSVHILIKCVYILHTFMHTYIVEDCAMRGFVWVGRGNFLHYSHALISRQKGKRAKGQKGKRAKGQKGKRAKGQKSS